MSGDPVFWVTYQYEPFFGRLLEKNAPISENQPSGAITAYEYRGHELWVTDPSYKTTKRISNAMGEVETAVDALGASTSYAYTPFGDLKKVVDAESHVTTISYDARGYKTELDDPNVGTWLYGYGLYGDLLTQTNANGQTTTLVYDAGGRLIERSDPDADLEFTYYTSGVGSKGKLRREEIDQAVWPVATYYEYSSIHGNPTLIRHEPSLPDYDYNMAYDGHGRLDLLYLSRYPRQLRPFQAGL